MSLESDYARGHAVPTGPSRPVPPCTQRARCKCTIRHHHHMKLQADRALQKEINAQQNKGFVLDLARACARQGGTRNTMLGSATIWLIPLELSCQDRLKRIVHLLTAQISTVWKPIISQGTYFFAGFWVATTKRDRKFASHHGATASCCSKHPDPKSTQYIHQFRN